MIATATPIPTPSAVAIADLTRVRATDPDAIARAWATRRRRPVGERLMIVAADHPARGALGVRREPMAMASRSELLGRLATAVSRPGVDGVLGTADILEDLLLMGLLDDKIVIGSTNRAGLQGASFEFDDRFTGYTTEQIVDFGLDGGKMLTRIALDDAATAGMLQESGRVITELNAARKLAMVEPFWSTRVNGRAANLLDPESVIKSVHVASGLGASSAYTWLKLPVVQEIHRVLDATTLPTLLLGGDPTAAPQETYALWADALTAPAAAGLVIGRALLFPQDDDVAGAVDIATALVHGGAP